MKTICDLTLWQKKQAALLYHFSSTQYLEGLLARVDAIVAYTDQTLGLAEGQERDRFLVDKQWGNRDTARNWSNNAWQFIEDFRQRTAREIAERSYEIFYKSGSDQCARGLSEFSLGWMTPQEEKVLADMMAEVGRYSYQIDKTMDKTNVASLWKDYSFAYTLKTNRASLEKLPKLKLRTDVEAVSGKIPPISGVYVPQDDPHGALQFAWTGSPQGKLLECQTFNQVGLDALSFVGRRDLWMNDERMFAFALSPKYRSTFEKDVFWDGQPMPDLASSYVSMKSSTTRACKWYFVELVPGEFEDYDDAEIPGVQDETFRVEAGQPCPKSGYYITPANIKSRRHFTQGEIMPSFPNSVWHTIWQSTD